MSLITLPSGLVFELIPSSNPEITKIDRVLEEH